MGVDCGAEAGVADGQGGVDGDEHEEGALGELVEDGFVVDVGHDEAGLPAGGDVFQEGLGGGEVELVIVG